MTDIEKQDQADSITLRKLEVELILLRSEKIHNEYPLDRERGYQEMGIEEKLSMLRDFFRGERYWIKGRGRRSYKLWLV